jgi:uncharacterized membrane protein
MKKIAIFIGLKIAEISGVFIALYLSFLVGNFVHAPCYGAPLFSLIGFLWSIIILCLLAFIGFLMYLLVFRAIPAWYRYNWKLAGRLNKGDCSHN